MGDIFGKLSSDNIPSFINKTQTTSTAPIPRYVGINCVNCVKIFGRKENDKSEWNFGYNLAVAIFVMGILTILVMILYLIYITKIRKKNPGSGFQNDLDDEEDKAAHVHTVNHKPIKKDENHNFSTSKSATLIDMLQTENQNDEIINIKPFSKLVPENLSKKYEIFNKKIYDTGQNEMQINMQSWERNHQQLGITLV